MPYLSKLAPFYCLCAALLLSFGCRSQRPDNVILIVVDTLRADHLGFYGYDRPTSPGLDRWARQGVIFEQAFSTSPWTLPTFGSILTGLSPSEHGAGARAQDSGKRWKRAPLLESIPTLTDVLHDEGWQTAAIVSNPFLREHFGLARGFDSYDYERGRTADAVVDRSLQTLDELQGGRFFLMIHLIDPHLPYRAPRGFRGRFSEVDGGKEIGVSRKEIIAELDELSESDRQRIVDRYDEEIAFVDQELSRFFEQLKTRGLFDNSLLIFTSDHGEELFEHGEFEHGHAMYQELLRVPLVIWESSLEPGRQDAPFSLVDLPQTAYRAVRGEPALALSGVSHWDAIRAGRYAPKGPLLAENTLWTSEQKALIRWPYKLIIHEKSGQRELFDLSHDPLEKSDLSTEQSDLADRLEKALRDQLASSEVGPVRESLEISDETEAELRSLGYLD